MRDDSRSETDDPVPVIDLSVAAQLTASPERTVELERLHRACSTCGVFHVANHGIADDLLQTARSHVDAFFDLPLEERMEIATVPGQSCGYEPLDRQFGEMNDSFCCVLGVDDNLDLGNLPHPGPARWPRRPPGFEDILRRTMAALHGVGAQIMSSIAMSLELPPDWFAPALGPRDAGTLRLRRYPPVNGTRIGTNAHVDGLPLALIVQNDVPGLETDVGDDLWKPIAPRPGTVVCQLGSLFSRWTNDRFVPNRHRVVIRDPGRERRSIIYWFPMQLDARIECLPSCCDPNDPPHYAPVSYLEYITQWVREVTSPPA